MTNNEIAQRGDDGTLEVFPPAQTRVPTAVAVLHEHAEIYNTAWKMAGQLVQTTMVPKRFFKKQADATAAILYGAELGLKPIQALQRVIPIHGMPSLEARSMVGLLKQQGYRVRTIEQSDESVTVEGIDLDGESYRATWTIERARRAGYVPTPKPGVENPDPNVEKDWVTTTKSGDWGSKTSVLGNMKYITDPQTMLKAKAQSEVCREIAPDVLMGISYSREEIESERQDQFDRVDERGAARGANEARTRPVSADEIFADEVPLDKPVSTEDPDNPTDNPRSVAEQEAARAQGVAMAEADERRAERDGDTVAPETPDGAVSEGRGDGPADPQPAPSEQPETVPETTGPTAGEDPEFDKAHADMTAARTAAMEKAAADQAAADREAKATSKKVAAKRSTAPAANPDKPKSQMRKAVERRLFALMKDAGLDGDDNRDGRIAVYRAIMENDAIGSTDDLDDVAASKVSDQLYAWQQQNVLGDEIGDILAIAVAAEETAKATADAPTSERN